MTSEARHPATAEELKPCPFCGDRRVSIVWEPCEPLSADDTDRIWFAECDRCGAQGPVQNRESECKEHWNRRGIDAFATDRNVAIGAKDAALREAMEFAFEAPDPELYERLKEALTLNYVASGEQAS